VKAKLIEELTADIIQIMDDCGGFSVEFDEPFFKEFCVDSLEGSYDEGLIGLISWFCHTKEYYARFLNEEQLKYVRSIFGEQGFVPAFNDEGMFTGLPFEFEEVENKVLENIALWAKDQDDEDDFPLDEFLKYYKEYGDDEMVAQLAA